MDFPKAPPKKTSGKLRLIIKPPGAEVEVEAGPPEPGPYDNLLVVKPPLGFSVDNDFDSVLARQAKNALASIDEIEKRYNKCSTCRGNEYSYDVLEQARMAVSCISLFLKGSISAPVQVVIGHDKNGEISVRTSYKDRSIFIIFRQSKNEIGYYNKVVLEYTEVFLLNHLTIALSWLKEDF